MSPDVSSLPVAPVYDRRIFLLLLILLTLALASPLHAQSVNTSPPTSAPPTSHRLTTAQTAAALDRITKDNADLLDLLKQQQAVLEDIQYDRRLQNRQISSLEQRLEDSLAENAQLQAKVAKLEEQISLGNPTPAPAAAPTPTVAPAPTPAPVVTPPPVKLVDVPTPPPPPASYLPAPQTDVIPGTKTWHRLFTLSGTDAKTTDIFHIAGVQWRILWHNQDHPGSDYANTSALFINAFPRDDSIPQKVCAKLGSGGDSTELGGPGNYYLKIEASGGSWELAVEDFR
jgi:hypothetical protein